MGDAGEQRTDGGQLLALVQRLALPLDLGDRGARGGEVAEIGGKIASFWQHDLGDRQFHRDEAPVPAARLHLDAAAEHMRLARGAIAGDARLVRVLHVVGDDEVADVPADGLLARIAERLDRGRIDGNHHAALVDDDDGVERRGDDGRIDGGKLLRRLQPVFRVLVGRLRRSAHAAALGGT